MSKPSPKKAKASGTGFRDLGDTQSKPSPKKVKASGTGFRDLGDTQVTERILEIMKKVGHIGETMRKGGHINVAHQDAINAAGTWRKVTTVLEHVEMNMTPC